MQETSGTALLDELIDGVHTGDNLVLQGDQAAPVRLLVDRFVAAAEGRMPLVLVNVAATWTGPVPAGAQVLDWSAVGSGTPSELEGALGPEATLEDALVTLEAADAAVGGGAAFVFDPLSSVPAAWGPDAALELFLSACPRLYRRRSLAVWPVRTDRHRPTFLRRLEEVTQVVVELADDAGRLHVTVRKADGRRPEVTGRSVHAEVIDGDLRPVDAPVTTRQRLGQAIRDQRLVRGLSQTEVARRVGISASALSQVERGVRGPSGDTLVRLWEVLDVPFGPRGGAERGYEVSRRSGRERVRLQEGLEGERVVAATGQAGTWLLEVAPGASGNRAPFAVKAPETVVILRGVLDLQLGGRTETFHEGDAVQVTSAAVTGWANPGPDPTEVSWTVHPR
ncbi:helix-turn-helix domain-containing protein [Nitriliruptor alkaliphilus]|uniref:helix-turn-helix domain-containing protein n=1 Tax=Nitriliruptor alkaliphilus TaxID=427918 RepID=UPI0006985393|nr:helix-turn-helix domain-containing protein [Nitriliruptor alkaliphilus]